MKWKAGGFLIIIFFITLLFFGTAVWMIIQNFTSGEVRWIFDILSAFLLISVFFWLFVLDHSIPKGD